jgi:disulfide bond formation protein DsbB
LERNEEFDFYREWYYREHDRRNAYNGALSLPVTVVTGLLFGINYIVSNLPGGSWNWPYIVVVVLLAAASITVAATIVLLMMALHPPGVHGYGYMPSPADMQEHRNKLEKYEKDLAQYESRKYDQGKVDGSFAEWIRGEIRSNTTRNFFNNNSKSKWLYLGQSMMMISIVLTLSALVPFTFLEKRTQIQAVELVNWTDAESILFEGIANTARQFLGIGSILDISSTKEQAPGTISKIEVENE